MARIRKVFKRTPKPTLTTGQLAASKQAVAQSLQSDPTIFDLPESKRTVDDITDFLIRAKEGENVQRLLPKEKR